MADEPVLNPIDARTVDFYGDQILAVLVMIHGQQDIYVPLRPLCEYLGLNWSGQLQRRRRDEVLSAATIIVRVEQTKEGKAGDPDLLCLLLDYLPGWLFGISISRVRPALRPLMTRYRRDCFRVLADAFPNRLRLPMLDDDDSATTACPGAVYVFRGGSHYKVGASRDAERRLHMLRRSLPFPVTPVCTIDTDDMFLLERQLHRLYRSRGLHVNGEWFALSTHDIDALKTIPSPLLSTLVPMVLHALKPTTGGQ
jgi:hypothetical protein